MRGAPGGQDPAAATAAVLGATAAPAPAWAFGPCSGQRGGHAGEPAVPAGRTGLRKAKREGTGAAGRRGARKWGPKPSPTALRHLPRSHTGAREGPQLIAAFRLATAMPPSAHHFCNLSFVYRGSEVLTRPPPRTPSSRPRPRDPAETARPVPPPPAHPDLSRRAGGGALPPSFVTEG